MEYQKYCKAHREYFHRHQNYPNLGETVWPMAILGAAAGLSMGIWKNFIPLPETVFRTVGAVMFTLTYIMAGALCGMVPAPLIHLGRRLVIRLVRSNSISALTGRLSKTPVVREVLRSIQDGRSGAVIITEGGIRLYDRIPDERYCDDPTDIYCARSVFDLDRAEAEFKKKTHWAVYDQTFKKSFSFSELGYEKMDDDAQMALANYLLRQCKEWGGVYHHAFGFYEAVSSSFTGKFTYNSHTGSITAHKDVDLTTIQRTFYRDYLLFRLDIAYAMASERKQKADAMRAQIKRW